MNLAVDLAKSMVRDEEGKTDFVPITVKVILYVRITRRHYLTGNRVLPLSKMFTALLFGHLYSFWLKRLFTVKVQSNACIKEKKKKIKKLKNCDLRRWL